MTLVIGTPLLVALGLALALCLGIIVATLVARRRPHRRGAAPMPAIDVSASDAGVCRAVGGER
jgi:hypothetical protein